VPYRVIDMIQIGPLHFRTWGLLVGLGLGVGLIVASMASRRRGLSTEKLYALAAIGIIAGLFGSKLLWALQPAEMAATLSRPWRAFAVWQGGLTLVGGLIFGFGAALIYAWRARVPVRRTFDAIALAVGPAIAVGRIGCYLTGLHPGKPTSLPWGIYYLGAVRHPIPSYESLLGVGLFVLALVLYRRRLPAGVVGLSVGLTYLVGRSLLDLLRATGISQADPRLLGGLTLTQTVTVVAAPILAVLIVWLVRRPVRAGFVAQS
jgi:phosphatidylglycerol:prolipoprotein diacylglycerol transferase